MSWSCFKDQQVIFQRCPLKYVRKVIKKFKRSNYSYNHSDKNKFYDKCHKICYERYGNLM